jgi:hypothetical protein
MCGNLEVVRCFSADVPSRLGTASRRMQRIHAITVPGPAIGLRFVSPTLVVRRVD